MNILLKLLGFGRCMCGNLIHKLTAKKMRFTDSPKDNVGYLEDVCNKCYNFDRR
jgi:hypothetical protein